MLVNMKDMLENAKAGHYAVGFFNAVNVEMARAVIETAEALHAPVIVGTAEVLLPFTPLERVAEYLIPMAKKAKVPIKNMVNAILTTEPKAEKRSLALVILSILSGYLLIIQHYKCTLQRYKDTTSTFQLFRKNYTQ